MFIQKLAWRVFQIGIVAVVLYADFDMSRETGQPPNPGLFFALGVGIAYAATLFVSVFLDLFRVVSGRRAVSKPSRTYVQVSEPRRSFGSPW